MRQTPLQEFLKLESDLTHMFDSDQRVAMALLEKIRTDRKALLEKEKEVIMRVYQDGLDNGFSNGNWKLEEYYNETFKTKER
jgi:hypothetical protein